MEYGEYKNHKRLFSSQIMQETYQQTYIMVLKRNAIFIEVQRIFLNSISQASIPQRLIMNFDFNSSIIFNSTLPLLILPYYWTTIFHNLNSQHYYTFIPIFITIMKKQIQQGQQQLIQHIQQKLAILRAQRNQIQYQKYASPLQLKPVTSATIPKASQKQQLQQDLANLQMLYEAKKQLRSAGIVISNQADILRFQNDPKMAEYVERRKKNVVEDERKKKIIEEEMEKTKKFLNSKKVEKKVIENMQEMNYRIILKDKREELGKFWQLVNKLLLNRVQKQQLINMSFQMLRQWNNLIRKQNLKKFLLANPQFCQHFYITHSEITRDLQVVQTKQPNFLSLIQLTQFIKSIELTNVHLLPASQKNKKQQKQLATKLINNLVSAQCQEQKTDKHKQKQKEMNEREVYRVLLEIVRKKFRELDRGNEGIVERAKFIAMISKGATLTSKEKNVDIETLQKFANFVMSKTKQKCKINYYKELDSKYINFSQIESLARDFREELKNNKQVRQDTLEKQMRQQIALKDEKKQQELENEQSGQDSETSTEINLSKQQGKQLTQKDYARYGWNKPEILKQDQKGYKQRQVQKIEGALKMKQMDEYYKGVSEKYGSQIAWGGIQVYKPDFKELQAFIKTQQEKMKNGGNQIHRQSHKNGENKVAQRENKNRELGKIYREKSKLRKENQLNN